MNRFSRIFAGITLFLVSVSFVSDTPACLTSLSVTNGVFKANDVEVNPDWKIKDVVASLGEANRIRPGYNQTHTYDRCGVVLFEEYVEEKGTGKLKEFQIYFSEPEKNNVTPNYIYTGSAEVDGLVITKALKGKDMRKALKAAGWAQTDSYTKHNYRMAKKGLYIYFLFNKKENKLIKISIGPDKKGS